MPQNPYGFEPFTPLPTNYGFEPFQQPNTTQKPEPSTFDWLMEQGLRTVPAVAGGFIGGVTGLPAFGIGAVGGSMAGGAAGSALGNVLGNWYSGKDFSLPEFATETALGAIPPIFGPPKVAGAGIKELLKYTGKQAGMGALEGGLVSAGSTPFQHAARTGSFDAPLEEYAGNAIAGAGMGGVLGGGLGYFHGKGVQAEANAPIPSAPPLDRPGGQIRPDLNPITSPAQIPQGPQVVTLKSATEIPEWKARGYVLIPGTSGYPKMARADVIGLYLGADKPSIQSPSVEPTVVGGRTVPTATSGGDFIAANAETVPIPNQNITEDLIQNMRDDGYTKSGQNATHTIFTKMPAEQVVDEPSPSVDELMDRLRASQGVELMEGPPIDISSRQRTEGEIIPGENRGRVATFQPSVGQSRPRQVYDVANDLEQTLRHNIQDDPNVERLMREAEDLILRETNVSNIEDHVRQLYEYAKKPNATDDERELFGSLFDLARGNLSEEQRTGRPSAPMDQTWRDLGNLETAFRGELQGTIPEGTGSRMLGQIPNRDAEYADIIRSIRPTDTPIIPPNRSNVAPFELQTTKAWNDRWEVDETHPGNNQPPIDPVELQRFRNEVMQSGEVPPTQLGPRETTPFDRPVPTGLQGVPNEGGLNVVPFRQRNLQGPDRPAFEESEPLFPDPRGVSEMAYDPSRSVSEARGPVDQMYGNREFQIEMEKVSRMSPSRAAQTVYRIDTMLNTMREQGHNRPTAVRQLEQIRAAADLRAREETPSTWGQPRTHEEVDQAIIDSQKADRREPSFAQQPPETTIRMKVGSREEMLRNQQGTYAEHGGRVANKELLQNAIDATPNGGTVEVELSFANGTIRVKDTGPGLPIDMIENEYVTLTGSGKRGVGAASGRKSIGEMGVGKATYLLGVDKFEVHTVAKEPDGTTWEYKFTGNADNMIGTDMRGKPVPPVTVRKKKVSDSTPTGTEVIVHDSDPANIKAAQDYLHTFAAYSDSPVNVKLTSDLQPGGYSWDQLRSTVNPRTTTVGQHIYSGSGPGGDYQMFVPTGAKWEDRSYATAIITSRGMFQGAQEINLGGKGNLPDRVVVNIEPTVSAQQAKLYPLTSPTRERMKDPFKAEIEAQIKTHLTEAAEKARQDDLKAAYAALQPDINAKTGNPLSFVVHDSGDRYTPAERAKLVNNPRMQTIAGVMKQMLDLLNTRFPTQQSGGKTHKFGFLIDGDNKGGMNVPDLIIRDNNAVLVNPFSAILKAMNATPQTASARMMHITAHEFNHNISRSEGDRFTWTFADVLSMLTPEEQVAYKNDFHRALTEPSGQYAPEISDLLQDYITARGRPDTTVDLLTRSAEGRFAQSPRQEGIPPRSGSDGGGVSTITGPATKTGGGGNQPPSNIPPPGSTGGKGFFRGKLGWGQGASKTGKHGKEDTNWVTEALSVPSALTTTGDLSFPGRQGLPLIFTKEFWQGAGKMFKGGLSQAAFDRMNAELLAKDLMTPRRSLTTGKMGPSLGEELGVKVYDLASKAPPSERVQGIMSRWLEQIPIAGIPIRASNRAFLTMLNHLSVNRIEFLMNKARDMSIQGLETAHASPTGIGKVRPGILSRSVNKDEAMDLNPYYNTVLGKEIVDFVNTAVGHAPLKTHLLPSKQTEVSLEGSAKKLSNVLFSPGLLARGVRMMNPSTYIMASPFVRKQYAKAALSTAAAWYGFTELAKLAGGDQVQVNNDPTSADFGKVRIGDARLDLGGGFLQFAVAYGRMYQGGSTSSSTGQFHRFGEGYQAQTEEDMMQRFMVNKLNPVTKFAYDVASASQYNPFHVKDRMVQMFVPLFIQDLNEIYKEDPSLLPSMGTAALFGGGTQIYGKGESVGKMVSPENDILYEGGRGLKDLMPWNLFQNQ